jgi:hypothetical protein
VTDTAASDAPAVPAIAATTTRLRISRMLSQSDPAC